MEAVYGLNPPGRFLTRLHSLNHYAEIPQNLVYQAAFGMVAEELQGNPLNEFKGNAKPGAKVIWSGVPNEKVSWSWEGWTKKTFQRTGEKLWGAKTVIGIPPESSTNCDLSMNVKGTWKHWRLRRGTKTKLGGDSRGRKPAKKNLMKAFPWFSSFSSLPTIEAIEKLHNTLASKYVVDLVASSIQEMSHTITSSHVLSLTTYSAH
jgi:hypothetical protein